MANSDPCLLLNLEYMYLVSISFSVFCGPQYELSGHQYQRHTFEDFVCLFVHETDERFTYSSNVFLYFAHNVSQIARECTLFQCKCI